MTHVGGRPGLGGHKSEGSQNRQVWNPSSDDWRGLTCLNGSSGCEAIWSSHPPDCNRRCEERLSWKREVALDVAINVERIPVVVRLEGMLEGATALNLEAVVAELIRDGYREFKLETSALCVPNERDISVLISLQRLAQNAGGNLAWDGLTVNHPFPDQWRRSRA